MTSDDVIMAVIGEGFISVDFETGEIYSYRISGRKGEKVKLNGATTKGYIVHGFNYQGLKRSVRAHRVVWMAKNGRVPEGLVIDHINRNRSDNRLCNLRVVTPQENFMNQENPMGENHITAKLSNNEVREIRSLYESTNLGVRKISKKFNISKSQVHNIVSGKSRKGEL